MSEIAEQIRENFRQVERLIKKACVTANRERSDINLIAVSKMQDGARIDAALAAGCRVFGENRVQDAVERWEKRKALYPDLQLHLIGPLQSNKVRDAVELFDCIHTLDRENLADALQKEMLKQNKFLPCFIQVNTGGENQKSGAAIDDVENLLAYVRQGNLKIQGLMCIPPLEEPPALHFALLKKIATQNHLKQLSMGMSQDYERAILLGATHIRVGTALFGAR